jgi:hypothetical protein
MSLLDYWPSADEVNLCINHEAEGAHDAVLLAVHQPSPLSYRLISSDRRIDATEEELFNYLITKDVPSGAHVMPITGASGVGKSHMVRVLAARLHSINEDGRYVVIRIPKSASLRKVVELILEKLPDDDVYASVKSGFAKALSEVHIDTAVISFQSQLVIALGELAKELYTKVQNDPTNKTLREQYGHAKALPYFMGDSVLVDHFRTVVFPRIVQRAIAGQNQAEQDSLVEDFHADDFQLPENIDITDAAAPTQSYYLRTLQVREGEGMRAAARLLNESKVVDQAIRQLFKLHESLGGMTLQEVILEIRRLLLKEGKELVIFVEDFKALTGIQDTLLKVLIQEGVYKGIRELATMRSVIAVTDGYLAGQDTIATRAKREWIVESHLSSDQEVLNRTKALVASYLNAARWGYDELVGRFVRTGGMWSSAGSWIPAYIHEGDDSDQAILTAFGRMNDINLFPYTDLAIEQLARSALTRNNVLVFTPRFVIDNILRDLLLNGRSAFERGQFPPPSIDAPRVNVEVTQWLASLPVSEEVRDRYRRVVGIWGNIPRTAADIGYIPKEVFDAFVLDRPDIETRTAPIGGSVQEKNKVSPASPPPPPPPPNEDFVEALEIWVQKNEPLKQAFANQIRRSIEAALNERIDWQAERCSKMPILAKQISIPNAAGEAGISADPIRIAKDNADTTGQLRSELAAVVRFYHVNNGKVHYAGADDDLVWIGNLVERLMPQALALVRAGVRQKLGVAVRLLATNSRILGLAERGRTPASLAPFLFGAPTIAQAPPEGAPQEFLEWRAFQEEALRVRPELMQMIALCCGGFQGTGKTAHSIDMLRIAECLSASDDSSDLGVWDLLTPEVRQTLQKMRENRVKPLAKKVLQVAMTVRGKLVAELGKDFDKQALADEFKILADQLREAGVWNTEDIGMGPQAFRSLCEEFRTSALRESLSILSSGDDLTTEEGGTDDHQAISRMGRFDVHPLLVTMRFVEAARRVVKASEKRAKALEGQFEGVDPKAEVERIQALLSGLLQEVEVLGLEGETACS